MSKPTASGGRAPADAAQPDPTHVPRNRLAFVTWLLEARRWTIWNGALDLREVPRPTKQGTRLPYWWAMREHAAKEYCERYVAGADPSQGCEVERIALPALTTYLLALECLEGIPRKRRAIRLLKTLAAAEHLPADLRGVVERVLTKDLVPHATWLGELEWALLEIAGVRWPGYVITRAELGEDCRDELERELGNRLLRGLCEFVPTVSGGGAWDARGAIFWAFRYLRLRPENLRPFLLRSAAEAATSSGRKPTERRDAALGVLGLWILLTQERGDWAGERELDGLRMIEADPGADESVADLARRILRDRAEAGSSAIMDLFWVAADGDGRGADALGGGLGQAASRATTPVVDVDGQGHITVDGESTSITLDSGPGDLLKAILKREAKVMRRKANRTILHKALMSASQKKLGVARASVESNHRKLTARVRIGPELRAQLGVGAAYTP